MWHRSVHRRGSGALPALTPPAAAVAPALSARPPPLQDKIDECIAKLEAVGAIQACADQANDMVDAAWDNLDRCLPDSFYKVVLRSFSWYLIQRHY